MQELPLHSGPIFCGSFKWSFDAALHFMRSQSSDSELWTVFALVPQGFPFFLRG